MLVTFNTIVIVYNIIQGIGIKFSGHLICVNYMKGTLILFLWFLYIQTAEVKSVARWSIISGWCHRYIFRKYIPLLTLCFYYIYVTVVKLYLICIKPLWIQKSPTEYWFCIFAKVKVLGGSTGEFINYLEQLLRGKRGLLTLWSPILPKILSLHRAPCKTCLCQWPGWMNAKKWCQEEP